MERRAGRKNDRKGRVEDRLGQMGRGKKHNQVKTLMTASVSVG